MLTVTGAGFATMHDYNLISTEPNRYVLDEVGNNNLTKYACVFSVEQQEAVDATSGGRAKDTLFWQKQTPSIGWPSISLPAKTVSHRRITCEISPWLFPAQLVTFRLFRGCCQQQQDTRNEHEETARQQPEAAFIYSGTDTSASIRPPIPSGKIDVPGDARYTWREVQRVNRVGDANTVGIPFAFLEGWLSLSPTSGAVGDGTVISIFGFGFDSAARYVCAFSSVGSGNVSRYLAEHQAEAAAVNHTHICCTPR